MIFAAVLGAAASAAAAGTSLAVPLRVRHTIKLRYPRIAFVPTRVPSRYHYVKWSPGRKGFDIYFDTTTNPTMTFDAVQGSCASHGHAMRTFHVNGVTVFWSATYEDRQAWRCIRTGGLQIGLSAARSIPGEESTNTPTKLGHALELVRLVAYAHRIR